MVFWLELQLWPFPESPVRWPSLLILNLPAFVITWTILQSKSHTHSITFVWRTLTVIGIISYQENLLRIETARMQHVFSISLASFGWMIWKHRCLIEVMETLERMLSSFKVITLKQLISLKFIYLYAYVLDLLIFIVHLTV